MDTVVKMEEQDNTPPLELSADKRNLLLECGEHDDCFSLRVNPCPVNFNYNNTSYLTNALVVGGQELNSMIFSNSFFLSKIDTFVLP